MKKKFHKDSWTGPKKPPGQLPPRWNNAEPQKSEIIAGFPFFHISFGQFFLERIFPGSRIVSDIFKSFSDKTERAPRI